MFFFHTFGIEQVAVWRVLHCQLPSKAIKDAFRIWWLYFFGQTIWQHINLNVHDDLFLKLICRLATNTLTSCKTGECHINCVRLWRFQCSLHLRWFHKLLQAKFVLKCDIIPGSVVFTTNFKMDSMKELLTKYNFGKPFPCVTTTSYHQQTQQPILSAHVESILKCKKLPVSYMSAGSVSTTSVRSQNCAGKFMFSLKLLRRNDSIPKSI